MQECCVMTALARNEQSAWLSTAEVARTFNVSCATVRSHRDELGGKYIGRQLRFPPQTTAPTLAIPDNRNPRRHR